MNLPSLRLSSSLKLWLMGALVALPFIGACGDDEEAPATPTTFALEIVDLEGGDTVARPHCDGTLAVRVVIGVVPSSATFSLRPPHACGSSGACGFVRTVALTANDDVLATAESVTTTTVLEIEPARLSELAKVRAMLVRGVDGELVTNPDKADVVTEAEPTLELPQDCAAPGSGGAGGQSAGGQGAGGQAGDLGGAGGLGEGGLSAAAGQGGASGGAASDGGAGGQGSFGGAPN